MRTFKHIMAVFWGWRILRFSLQIGQRRITLARSDAMSLPWRRLPLQSKGGEISCQYVVWCAVAHMVATTAGCV